MGLLMRIVALLPLGEHTVLITNGTVRCTRGTIAHHLLASLAELGLSNACLHGTTRGKARLLQFGVPAQRRQRVRNVWFAHAD